jgi:hypothetical protein
VSLLVVFSLFFEGCPMLTMATETKYMVYDADGVFLCDIVVKDDGISEEISIHVDSRRSFDAQMLREIGEKLIAIADSCLFKVKVQS